MEQNNRESWLNWMTASMVPFFEALDAPPLPSCVRVKIGFTSRDAKEKCVTIHSMQTVTNLTTTAKRLITFTTRQISCMSRLAA